MLTKDIMKRTRADASLLYNEKASNLHSLRVLKSEYKQIITQIEYFQANNSNFNPNFIKMTEFFSKLNNLKIPDELKSEQNAVQTITELKALGKQHGEIFAQQKFAKMYQLEQSHENVESIKKKWHRENIIVVVSLFLALTIPVALILAIKDHEAMREGLLSHIDHDIIAPLLAIDPSLDSGKMTVGQPPGEISKRWDTLKTTIVKIKNVLDGNISQNKEAKPKRKS